MKTPNKPEMKLLQSGNALKIMKKLSMLLIATITFACSTPTNDTTNEETNDIYIEENVDEYAGENITPQVDLDSGNNDRLEVDVEDTVSSAQEINAGDQ